MNPTIWVVATVAVCPVDDGIVSELSPATPVEMPVHWGVGVRRAADGVCQLSGHTTIGETTLWVESCNRLYATLRARETPRTLSHGPWRVEIGIGSVRGNATAMVDFARDQCSDTRVPVSPDMGEAPLCAGDVCSTDSVSFEYRLLSLFGPFLSVSKRVLEQSAGGPPYSSEHWHTYDSRTGKRVDLRALVDLEDLDDAVSRDPHLRKLGFPGGWKALEPGPNPNGFAVVGASPESGLLLVRHAYTGGYCGLCPNRVVELGFELKPKPEFARHLRTPSPLLSTTDGFDRRLIGEPMNQPPSDEAGGASVESDSSTD